MRRIDQSGALAVAALLMSPLSLAADVAVGPMQRVSEEGRRSISPEIAVGPDGAINVIWLDKGSRPAADAPPPKRKPGEHSHRAAANLMFVRSEDGGRSWSAPSRINPEPNSIWGFAVSKPVIGVGASGTIHVFYPANDTSPLTGLDVVAAKYTRSTDSGKSFETPRKINRPSPTDQRKILKEGLGAAHAFGTMGVAPDGSVYAFWLDARDLGDAQDGAMVYATVSRDDGKTFAEDDALFAGDACPCCQVTTAFGGNGDVLVGYRKVYADGRDSTVALSNNRGGSFERTRLPLQPWDIKGCPLKPTALAVDGNTVFAVSYTAGQNPAGVYMNVSQDGGRSFAPGVQVHPGAGYSDAPDVTTTADGTTRIVWQSKVDGKRRLFLRESRDGKNFDEPSELATPAGASAYPASAVAPDGTLYLVWQQGADEIHVLSLAGPTRLSALD